MGRGGTNIGKDVQRFATYIAVFVVMVVFLVSIAEDTMTVLGFRDAGAHTERVNRVRPPSGAVSTEVAENVAPNFDIIGLVADFTDGEGLVDKLAPDHKLNSPEVALGEDSSGEPPVRGAIMHTAVTSNSGARARGVLRGRPQLKE